MSILTRRRTVGGGVALLGVAAAGLALAGPGGPLDREAARCPAVDVAFARGSGEPDGLGGVGKAFTATLERELGARDVTVYPVEHAAAWDQRSVAAGAGDVVEHVRSRAAACPSTRFVLGGYSQGASIVGYALGALGDPDGGGAGEVLPPDLRLKVGAVVLFGNPLELAGFSPERTSGDLAAATRSYCADGDVVCGGGRSVSAHRSYVSAGITSTAAEFAASRLR